jgi:hypothetical protein
MSLQLDVALREIYFERKRSIHFDGKTISKCKGRRCTGCQQEKRQDIVTNTKHVHHSQTVPETLQNPKDVRGRTIAADPNGPCGHEKVQLQE